MSYQQSSYTTRSLLLHQQQQNNDKNDTSPIDDTGNDDPEIALSLYNSDTTKVLFQLFPLNKRDLNYNYIFIIIIECCDNID